MIEQPGLGLAVDYRPVKDPGPEFSRFESTTYVVHSSNKLD